MLHDYQPATTPVAPAPDAARQPNTEAYQTIDETPFVSALKQPLSTFSLDVDTASYSNLRRFLAQSVPPPKDALRTEELVNYFDYDYPEPKGPDPVAIVTELSDCPWNPGHKLLHLGLQARHVAPAAFPPGNLVFLIDVSGSMSDENKLPLLRRSLSLLLEQLRPVDRVSIVVYAGAAGVVLPPTPGSEKARILKALDQLEAGGSTAGGQGITLAYELARQSFVSGGNNRVVLATDGDFNIGPSSDAEMVRLIEDKRKSGVYLTVLGYGMGNYKDGKLEQLADKGNGNYAYIDNLAEARKVLVTEMGGTLLTIAKDVKLQIEFNPVKVAQYRLIGYENRVLPNAHFDDDAKDAGELGSGHAMTALYEIEPASGARQASQAYQYQTTTVNARARNSSELMSLKLRYKQPDSAASRLMSLSVPEQGVPLARSSDNFRFAAAVAGFGLLMRDSEFKGELSFAQIRELAQSALGQDADGYRSDFLDLIESAEQLRQTTHR